ncbi:4-amino-4-deoxychorismate lyase [Alteribacter lacisalsi]|uniref:4-amino-4-deoxychorismate lyase n=1 Tax=Alteribacter lacisalsi TaxID=2045244 RepID=A0A2W0H2H3_9BACI|nr:aminodeoxychorismate lyase [Alteribacter lacisalsi]PYZ95407.1 4-amino-4-deoxychorismate lyase [Alteribacter lacisalsi]
MIIYANGRFIEEDEAAVSPFDHGFLYGLGVFETFRTYNGHPFLLDDHFHRLSKGLSQLNIRLKPYIRTETAAIISELLTRNGLKDAYFRWNVSAGSGPVGLQTDEYTNPNVFVFVKRLPEGPAADKTLQVLAQPRNTPEGPERLKSHHYLNSVLGKRETAGQPDTEGLFLTAEGFVAEGVVSNVFWRKGETVYTPSVDCGILNGITRQFVLSLLREQGVRAEVGSYLLGDLREADEVFVTNSIQEIAAVSRVDGRTIPGRSGKLYQSLSRAYRQAAMEQTRWTMHTEQGR